MRLKSLFRCLGCHLILVILVCFSVAGYLLRGELTTLLGWAEVEPGLTQRPMPEVQSVAPAPGQGATEPVAGTGEAVAPAPRPSAGALGQQHPMVGPEEPEERLPEGAAPRDVVPRYGGFRFRPLDDAGLPEGADAERRNEMLAAARRAYWSDNAPLAIRHYEALIAAYPNEPDFFGELGNIYYQQGEQERAGQAYYQAALLLLRRGNRERAEDLADLLRSTAPGYAEELSKHLQGTP